MVYNDTVNKQGLVQDTYFNLTNVTSDDYPANDVKRNINKAYRMAMDIIMRSMDNWDFQDTIATGDIVGDQQDYTFKTSGDFNITDVIKVERVELSYDGTNWVRAQRMNKNDYLQALNDGASAVNANFNITSPFYSLNDDSLSLYPIPDTSVTNGIKLYYKQDLTDLSADGDIPVIASQFHTYLSLSAAYDYAIVRGLKQAGALRQEIGLMEQKMANFYSSRAEDGHTVMQARVKNYN